MIRVGKKFHTTPFIINTKNLEELYNLVLEYSDVCIIEVINFANKEREIRQFKSLDEFHSMKNLIISRINKFILKGYKGKELILSFEFDNSTNKFFPLISPCTLKSNFSIDGEEEYQKFVFKYSETINCLVSHEKNVPRFCWSMGIMFLAMAMAIAMISDKAHSMSIVDLLATTLFLFLCYSIALNIMLYPGIYYFNPLITFNIDINRQGSFIKNYFRIKDFFTTNAQLLLVATISGLVVMFSGRFLDLFIKYP